MLQLANTIFAVLKRLSPLTCSVLVNNNRMVKYLFTVGFLIFTGLLISTKAQDNSVLSDGFWYKVKVSQSGIYKLTRSDFSSMGFDVNGLDPRTIKIYGNPGGMVPQDNSENRPVDLIQNAIKVTGQADGSFDNQDAVIFYAEGPDAHSYDEDGYLIYEKNIYSESNYYFITAGGDAGKRITTASNEGNSFPEITTYNSFKHHELTENNLLISGRKWYGERFDFTTQFDIDFTFNDIVANTEIRVTSKVMAQSFAPSQFTLNLNGSGLGEQEVSSVPDFRERIFRYSIKGRENTTTFIKNSSEISNRNNLTVGYSYEKNNSGQSIGFLDYVTVEAVENLKWSGSSFIFRSIESTNNPTSTYKIKEAVNQLEVWNITEYGDAKTQEYDFSQSEITFGSTSSTLNEFVVFDASNLPSPELTGRVENQNLRSLSAADFLIITHPNFITQANRLASFRLSNDNLSTHVVQIQNIYNEFSSGRQDVSAIRDFIKQHYAKGSLKYVLLFGRGSYDYLDVIDNNTNYIPIYQSRNSLHPLDTYGSDDYFGFLEDSEGSWVENSAGTHTLDVGVGRLPVTNSNEAQAVVDKLIRYATNKDSFGDWRNKIAFVADDGDINLHQRQADQLTRFVDTTFTPFLPSKLYLDAFRQESKPGGETSPEASEALSAAVENGALIVNYTGHGGEIGWMQEQVLSLEMINNWKNNDNLPLFVTATCEFSRHDDPSRVSGGELVLTNPSGGGIGIVSTCRPVSSSSNFDLNKAFYTTVFEQQNGEYVRLGDVFRLTKNNPSVNKIGNRNFSLLGDPSLRLVYPNNSIEITSIKNNGIESDTVNALSEVSLDGIIKSGSSINSSFNGTLKAVFFDKEILLTTLGNENPPFNYYDKENLIFNGTASVVNGEFSVSFVVPKNISYQFDAGKISLYAVDKDNGIDANGAKFITVGGSSTNPDQDNLGPEISLFIGDTTLNNLKNIASNTRLFAYLKDENGINISGFGLGNSLKAILDDSLEFEINKYYESSLDTYTEGWVEFPIENLSAGTHKIKVIAWDTFNNPSEQTIEFQVADPNTLILSNLRNYPNPFSESTSFTFRHNRPGEDLEAQVKIISSTGREILNSKYIVENSNSIVNLTHWDGISETGEKVNQGIYIYKLRVRSLNDGAVGEQHQKLILID